MYYRICNTKGREQSLIEFTINGAFISFIITIIVSSTSIILEHIPFYSIKLNFWDLQYSLKM